MFVQHIKQPEPFDSPISYWDDLVEGFPTVAVLDNGSRCFWQVPDLSLDLRDDIDIGVSLAKETLSVMCEKHQNQGVLAKILEKAPADCLIAKGFRMEIENTVFKHVCEKT